MGKVLCVRSVSHSHRRVEPCWCRLSYTSSPPSVTDEIFSSWLISALTSHSTLLRHLRHSRFLSSSARGSRGRINDKSPTNFHLLLFLLLSALSHVSSALTHVIQLFSGVRCIWIDTRKIMVVNWSLNFPRQGSPSLHTVTVCSYVYNN